MLPLSLSVPIVGVLSLRMTIAWSDFLALAGIGTCAHFFGFILNDLMDLHLDRNHPFRQRSPLVRGEVKTWQAWLFALAQIPLAYLLYRVILSAGWDGFLWLIASVTLSIIYNLFSKWRWLPRILAELSLAGSITCLALAGAWVFATLPPPDTWLFCLSLGVVLLLVNSVPSGLKDIQFDKLFGARSFVLSTGSTVSQEGDLILNDFLRRYAFIIQALIIFLLIALALIYTIHLPAVLLLIVLQWYANLQLWQILHLTHVDQFQQRMLFLGGYYNYLSLLVIVWAYLPPLIQIATALVILRLLSIPLMQARQLWTSRNKRVIVR